MKIKYLGTAAAEGVPAFGCQCEVCRRARSAGGRNVRSRSQALVNDDLLLDFNADTLWHVNRYSVDLNRVDHCLITHSHSDHLYPADIENYRPEFYHGRERTMNFYAAKDGYEKIKAIASMPCMKGVLSLRLVAAGERFSTSDGKYSVLPLWANHDPAASPVIYSIACDGKRLLYAHDTGVFSEKTWAGLRSEKHFDLVSLDCTGCLALGGDWTEGHMSFGTNMKTVGRMKEEGLIDEKTLIVVNHFSHNGGQTYDEMLPKAEKYGVIVSYDGLELEF